MFVMSTALVVITVWIT